MEVVEKVRKARASRAKKKVELSAKDREKAQFAARKAMPKSPIRYHVAHGFGYQNRADLRAMWKKSHKDNQKAYQRKTRP